MNSLSATLPNPEPRLISLNQYNKLQNIECYSVALMQDRCKKEEVIYTGGTCCKNHFKLQSINFAILLSTFSCNKSLYINKQSTNNSI